MIENNQKIDMFIKKLKSQLGFQAYFDVTIGDNYFFLHEKFLAQMAHQITGNMWYIELETINYQFDKG